MQQAVDSLALEGLPDARKHCLASAVITLRCGGFSAATAGYAKEVSDAFGPGDAAGEDLRANRAGRDCARTAPGAAGVDLSECCTWAGY